MDKRQVFLMYKKLLLKALVWLWMVNVAWLLYSKIRIDLSIDDWFISKMWLSILWNIIYHTAVKNDYLRKVFVMSY